MAEENRTLTRHRDFPGIFLGQDPHDRKEGEAIDQVNFISTCLGEGKSRRGFRFVTFEDD